MKTLRTKTWSPSAILADPDPLNVIEDLEEADALPEFLIEPLAEYHAALQKACEKRDDRWHALLEEDLDRYEYRRRDQELEQKYSNEIDDAVKQLLLKIKDINL